MKCPHCLHAIHSDFAQLKIRKARSGTEQVGFAVAHMQCPQCAEAIIYLQKGGIIPSPLTPGWDFLVKPPKTQLIYPRSETRFCPPEVPESLRAYFTQAAEVLTISPMASAAMSRRCLQMLLHDIVGATQRNLSDQIDAVIDQGNLPSTLLGQLHAVREVGNFGAHPMKNTNTGEVIEVEPHEAEWNLDVLEELFDFYLVAPARAKAKVAALNAKLELANRKPVRP